MKVFIVILAIVAVVSADDGEWRPSTSDEVTSVRDDCLKKHPVPQSTLDQVRQFFIYPDVEPLRQYNLCIVLKLEVFSTHEGYNAERMTKQYNTVLDEAEALAIVKGCLDKNEQGSASDVWAYRGYKCLMDSKVSDALKASVRSKQLAEKSGYVEL